MCEYGLYWLKNILIEQSVILIEQSFNKSVRFKKRFSQNCQQIQSQTVNFLEFLDPPNKVYFAYKSCTYVPQPTIFLSPFILINLAMPLLKNFTWFIFGHFQKNLSSKAACAISPNIIVVLIISTKVGNFKVDGNCSNKIKKQKW